MPSTRAPAGTTSGAACAGRSPGPGSWDARAPRPPRRPVRHGTALGRPIMI
ncbi:putative lipoprotein [Propionibacterium acidifaciens F0233]|uniref:Lipoprotein n=1 Tax=Propionibacterium acidifaciens F0233 TaxID=553198 RepID=U2QBG3_9ACTN|nr:putative lipoprotein [Propionibacterium acidifaciens F0233]